MATLSPYNFGDLQTTGGISKLNNFLQTCSYVNGATPTKDDVYIASMVSPHTFTRAEFPHVKRWYTHINYFSKNTTKNWPNGKMKTPPKPTEKNEATPTHTQTPEEPKEETKTHTHTPEKENKNKEEDDDFDPFADDDEDEDALEEAKKLAVKKKAEREAAAGKTKKPVINKSSLVIEVKPNSLNTNLDDVKKMINEIEMEGLTWGEASRKVPLAFGLYKLQVNCTIIDDLVNTETIIDKIEVLGMSEEEAKNYLTKKELGDGDEDEDEDEESSRLVQSAEIISFNKL